MKRRRLGTVLVVAGALLLAYAAATLFWRDPVTDDYARYQQHKLESALAAEFRDYRELQRAAGGTGNASADLAAVRKAVKLSARRFRGRLELGQPLGRIVVPKLGLDAVFVHGTRWGPDLSRGPGHYERTSLPGLGRTTAIAGHRTTFGAPFRHIDSLARGDRITLRLPYGTFHYRVFAHEIVRANDWDIIRRRGFDALVLSACHPLYGASHRWIVYARLARVEPVGGQTYTIARRTNAAAPS